MENYCYYGNINFAKGLWENPLAIVNNCKMILIMNLNMMAMLFCKNGKKINKKSRDYIFVSWYDVSLGDGVLD